MDSKNATDATPTTSGSSARMPLRISADLLNAAFVTGMPQRACTADRTQTDIRNRLLNYAQGLAPFVKMTGS
jgi:hypothetical protein